MSSIEEIKQYSDEILDAMTERDKTGRGYICPVCGSGSGKKGTGLAKVPHKDGYYKCFNIGCGFYGDILELIGKTYHLTETSEQIEKAGELIHRDFSDKKQWFNEKKTTASSGEGNKNMVQNNDKVTEDKNSVVSQDILREQAEIKEFMRAATAALTTSEAALQYLLMRGISKETATRYKLGYVANYGDGMNTPAIIIPTGPYSYTARSMTADDSSRKVRKKKAGEKAGIYGIGITRTPPPIAFVVEGEFDKLAINEAGYPAISTGGGTSKRELVEELKKLGPLPTTFVIIPDNDIKADGTPDTEKGIKAGRDLLELMKAAGIRAEMIDVLQETNWPQNCKDCNEYLQLYRAAFISFLNRQRYALEEKELGRVSGYMPEFVSQIAGNTPPVPTGYPKLDGLLEGGLHPGLVVIGAISSLGKTTFCLNIADMLATAGHNVLFYSLEMSKFELIAKIISRRTAIKCLTSTPPLPLSNAKTNLGISDFKRYETDEAAGIKGYSDDEKNLIFACMQEFSDQASTRLSIHEGMMNVGTERIRQDLQKHDFYVGSNHRPVVIIDYTQILKSPDVHMTDKQKTDENIVELKRISRDFNIPIICISSFNRDNYKEPVSMAAFKESGAIEYTSDVLIGLQYLGMDWQEGQSEKDRTAAIRKLFDENKVAARQGRAIAIQCKVLKNRSGGKDDCIFNYFPMFNLYLENTEL